MAPKAASSADSAEFIELFKSIGLTQSKAAEAAKSSKSASILKDIIEKKDLVAKKPDEKTGVRLDEPLAQRGYTPADENGWEHLVRAKDLRRAL